MEAELQNAIELNPSYDKRPWGSFAVVDEGKGFKVKRIEVKPGRRLSYQLHARRAEHWFIVHGVAQVTLNGCESTLREGEAIDIPIGAAHRIKNIGQELLVFIEIQRGDYLGEDDISRLEDDFGRTAETN